MIELTKRERDMMFAVNTHTSSQFPARLSEIAKKVHLKPPTVIEILRRLERKGLIIREKGMIRLTDIGKKKCDSLVRSHRILEALFVESGVDIQEACSEVSSFDYLVQTDAAEKISKLIGRPEKCPHGYPIKYR